MRSANTEDYAREHDVVSVECDAIDRELAENGHLAGRSDRREIAEMIVDRARFLEAGDRALIRAIYERGLTVADLAKAHGASERTLQRRVRRLIQRLASPEFQAVLRQRMGWPVLQRRVAERVFLRGQSLRAAALELGVSLYQVRLEVQRIRIICTMQAAR